ncbi:MAG: hypothetical protein LAO08_19065 [Acidobacteriia bacterium]|nr:hypothetical protein [Terriglobia bacterium]
MRRPIETARLIGMWPKGDFQPLWFLIVDQSLEEQVSPEEAGTQVRRAASRK